MKHERWERLQRESEALQAWARKPVPIPIMYRANDPILHTDATPFCDDARCPCHCLANSGQTFIETIEQPIRDGLLTTAEGLRLYWGEQI